MLFETPGTTASVPVKFLFLPLVTLALCAESAEAFSADDYVSFTAETSFSVKYILGCESAVT